MNKNDELVVKLLNEFFSKEGVSGHVKSVLEKSFRIEIVNLHKDKPRVRQEIYNFVDAEARLKLSRQDDETKKD